MVEPAPSPLPVPTPTPRPAPAPAVATVSVEGADGLIFHGADGDHAPPSVPPGDYAVDARFGERVVPVGRLQVPQGAVTVHCDRLMGRCAIRR